MIGKTPDSGNLRRLHRVVTLPSGGANRMDRRVPRMTSIEGGSRTRDVLAARLGRRSPAAHVAPSDAPEAIMTISFEGLTEREQEMALAAFPGGKRFVLAS